MALLCTGALADDTVQRQALACTVCHGREGRAAADGFYPRIAGKPAGYLLHQLQAFREGRRSYGLMTTLLDPLSDHNLRELAEHFAALELPYPAPQRSDATPAQQARGRELVERGDPARKLPACAACHGPALMGMQPAVPALLGLPRDYLNAQLGAWQAGSRRALAPDCMAQIARGLSGDDVAALSAWLSSQPVPTPARPAPAASGPLPLRCGSINPSS